MHLELAQAKGIHEWRGFTATGLELGLQMGLQMVEGCGKDKERKKLLTQETWIVPRKGSQAVGSETDLKEMNSQE